MIEQDHFKKTKAIQSVFLIKILKKNPWGVKTDYAGFVWPRNDNEKVECICETTNHSLAIVGQPLQIAKTMFLLSKSCNHTVNWSRMNGLMDQVQLCYDSWLLISSNPW